MRYAWIGQLVAKSLGDGIDSRKENRIKLKSRKFLGKIRTVSGEIDP